MTTPPRLSADVAALVGDIMTIFQCALELHEALETNVSRVLASLSGAQLAGAPVESGGNNLIKDLCAELGVALDAIEMSPVATVLLSYAVFGDPPLTFTHRRFSEALLMRLEDPNARLLMRQLRQEPLRAWQYRQLPIDRDRATPLAGPARGHEEPIDCAISLETGQVLETCACVAWPITFRGVSYLLSAGQLTGEAKEQIEKLAPFPLPDDEAEFWRDHAEELLQIVLEPTGAITRRPAWTQESADAFRDGSHVPTQPAEQPQELLVRVLLGAGFDIGRPGRYGFGAKLTRARWPREQLATAHGASDLEALNKVLIEHRYRLLGWAMQGRFSGDTDPKLEAWLPIARIFSGFGAAPDGTMPAAPDAALQMHPLAILGLPDDHDIMQEVHPQEPIRDALRWAEAHAGSAPADDLVRAFETFRSERRWSATFSTLSMHSDDHIDRLDVEEIMHGLSVIFDPRLLQTRLDQLDLAPRYVGQLETATRPVPYTDDNLPVLALLPCSEAALLRLRNIGPSTLVHLKRALLACADGWRGRFSGAPIRTLAASSAQGYDLGNNPKERLHQGLSALAALFEEDT